MKMKVNIIQLNDFIKTYKSVIKVNMKIWVWNIWHKKEKKKTHMAT